MNSHRTELDAANPRPTFLRLSAAELQALLEGLDWRRVHERRVTAVPTATSGLGRRKTVASWERLGSIVVVSAQTDALPDDPGLLKAMLIAEQLKSERLNYAPTTVRLLSGTHTSRQ